MELLIPGLVLVALMIYASTRIKKSATKAFEAEQIETAEFSITKPEGLLIPIDDASPYAFEAYSKDFGEEPNERVRQISASVKIFDNTDPGSVARDVKSAAERIVSESYDDGAAVIETEELVEEAEVTAVYKIASRDGRAFRLRVQSLREQSEDNRRRIQEMLESFRTK